MKIKRVILSFILILISFMSIYFLLLINKEKRADFIKGFNVCGSDRDIVSNKVESIEYYQLNKPIILKYIFLSNGPINNKCFQIITSEYEINYYGFLKSKVFKDKSLLILSSPSADFIKNTEGIWYRLNREDMQVEYNNVNYDLSFELFTNETSKFDGIITEGDKKFLKFSYIYNNNIFTLLVSPIDYRITSASVGNLTIHFKFQPKILHLPESYEILDIGSSNSFYENTIYE